MAEIKTATKPVKVYQVGKRDSYVIVAQLSPEFTAKLVKRGYFTWKPTDIEYGGKPRYTLMITPRGQLWLATKYLEFIERTSAA